MRGHIASRHLVGRVGWQFRPSWLAGPGPAWAAGLGGGPGDVPQCGIALTLTTMTITSKMKKTAFCVVYTFTHIDNIYSQKKPES